MPRRAKLPTSWRDAFGAGAEATLSRTFHRPTGLSPGDRVLVCVESEHEVAAVSLAAGAIDVAPGRRGCWDVTPGLQDANRLSVTLRVGADPDAGVLEAWLEISTPPP